MPRERPIGKRCKVCKEPIADLKLRRFGRCIDCLGPILEGLATTDRYHRSRVTPYDLTADEFIEMWTRQDGRCAICYERADTIRDLHIDHDHQTGLVRGLLCPPCNKGLGHFRDNPQYLKAASRYLRKYLGD